MSSAGEGVQRSIQLVGFDQYVVRIKGGNRKNPDPCFRQRIQKRGQYARHLEWEWTLQLKTGPAGLSLDSYRDVLLRANNGKFTLRSRYGKHTWAQSPFRQGSIRIQLADRKPAFENGIPQPMCLQTN